MDTKIYTYKQGAEIKWEGKGIYVYHKWMTSPSGSKGYWVRAKEIGDAEYWMSVNAEVEYVSDNKIEITEIE